MSALQWFCVYHREHMKVKTILITLMSGCANVIVFNTWGHDYLTFL